MSGTEVQEAVRPPDEPLVRLRERAVLRKFDGDIEPGKTPVEVLLIEDGTITGHWTGEEVANAPEE